MRKVVAVLVMAAALIGSRAHAAATFQYLFDFNNSSSILTSVSSNGNVVVGQMPSGGTYVPCLWTQATGLVSMGRAPHLGAGGTALVSGDGSVVAASIGSPDSSYTTQGRWTQASGWQELMPPAPAGGGTLDGAYGNVFGLSGNGQTVVGLYSRPGPGNRAHASKWTKATGVVDLGGTVTGQASRANCVNYDGSVIAGWVEAPTGNWRPAAWDNGSLKLLTNFDGSGLVRPYPLGDGEVRAANFSGDIITGFSRDSLSGQRAAAMWRRTNGVWGPTQILGWVNGTQPPNSSSSGGINIASSVSADGKIVVGYCSFDGSQFGTTGLVWTPATGVVDVNVFLANNGVLVDPNFTIQTMVAVTPDGRQLFGYGQKLVSPYTRRAFKITLPGTLDAPPPAAVAGLQLAAPSPNPSSVRTRLEFDLPSAANAELSVFDAAGRRVATLVQGDLPAGRHSASWDGVAAGGERVAAGLYFARLSTPQGSVSRRIVRSN